MYVFIIANTANTNTIFIQIACYVLGLLLSVFNLWAKRAAHRVVGDYAWFWGDFFFRMEQELTFDGIFQMFPHPMYTVGYEMANYGIMSYIISVIHFIMV